ncbi:MAG: ASKHA domain-containing protein [Clostridiales bacterium]|nr:ASKHA domain-containing protein [Clostridiales bacterium]MCF8023254.1 ASKHA domain-containing protein [Clostridiales bacterium]
MNKFSKQGAVNVVNNNILRERVMQEASLDPIAQKICMELDPPSLSNNQADVDKARQYLENVYGNIRIPLNIMQKLSSACKAGNWKISGIVGKRNSGWELIDAAEDHNIQSLYGIAVDIGTTTVVVYLIDMESGKIIDIQASYNKQVDFGEDILTRIFLAGDENGRQQMKNAAVETLNILIRQICERKNLKINEIYAAAVAGNSTMIHLLLGLDPSNICISPYIPVVNNPGFLTAGEVGLEINSGAPVYCLPGVGSYVGGDAVAGVLVSEMYKKKEVCLFVDIGTNGEIIMGNKDWLVACAGAAGPALEGGVAQSGMRAEPGAVEEVAINMDKEVQYKVIGDEKPKGICGSGLIDCLAQLFLAGLVDRGGKLTCEDYFVIVPGAESATGEDILVTQQDIDNLMRTKGAVSAALDYLVESVGVSLSELGYFYTAGAFGQYLNLESAVNIGLYPDLQRERMIRLGNSSGEGARLVLISDQKRKDLEAITKNITYFELNASNVFMNKFVSSKFLPHTNLDFFPTVKERLIKRGIISE